MEYSVRGFMDVRYVSSQGYRIAYVAMGEGPVTVVQIPGWVSHVDMMWPDGEAFLRRIGSVAQMVAFDKRGTGASDRVAPGEIPTLEERVEDLNAILDAVDADEVVLFGTSEGGPMSILYSTLHPDRVRGLVLYGTYARWDWDDFGLNALADTPEGVEQFFLENWGTEPGAAHHIWNPEMAKDPEAREMIARWLRAAASPAAAVSALRSAHQIDVTDLLESVQVPTVIVHNTGDLAIPVRCAREIANAIPGAKLIEVEGTDHNAVPWDLLADEIEVLVTGAVQQVADIERVLTTVLFTDIVDSTATAAGVGDQRWRELLDEHDRVSGATVERFGGRLVKHTGDGVMACFDGPAAAVRCAHQISANLNAVGLTIRAGVHTGEVERRDHDIGGIGVHIASRIASLAEPNQVLTSTTVRDLTAGSGLSFQTRGTHQLKGVPNEWELLSAHTND